jgi:hypothetical protein
MIGNSLLIWCGDSWSFGTNLSEENVSHKDYRFPTLVNKALGINGINLARPGSSIGHLVYKIEQIKRIKQHNLDKRILVLFGLTVPSRLCVETDAGIARTVSINDFDLCAYVSWANNVFNNNYILKESCLTISWIAEQCRKSNLDFRFYNILCNQNDFDKSKFSKYLDYNDWLISEKWSTYSELFDIENLNFDKIGTLERTPHGKKCIEQYWLSDRHPNISGHKKIADKLAPHIEKILNEH